MKIRRIRLALPAVLTLALVVAAAACDGGSTKSESTNGAVEGSWQFTGGTFLPQDASLIGTPTFLQLSRSGTGTLFARTPFTGVVGCASLLGAVVNGTVFTLQVPVLSQSEIGDTTYYFTWVRTGDSLILTDVDGNSATFQKVDSVPAAAACNAVTTTSIALSLPPQDTGGIGTDGTKLYWTDVSGTQWVTFDPATLTSSAVAIPFSAPAGLIRAAQGPNDFWVDCYCGANQTISRVGVSGTSMDMVDTSAAPISSQIVIRAASFHAAHLWLGGDGYNGSSVTGGKLLKIDSEAEPDTLTASFNLDVTPQGIAFVGTRLFILANFLGPELVELDPSIGTALAVWKLPIHYYGGVAAVGNTLYLENLDDNTLLALDVP